MNTEVTRVGTEVAVKSWDDFEVSSVDLNFQYWSPEKPGEFRFGIYKGVHNRDVPDFNDDTLTVTLPCAVFHDPVTDDVFVNGSKILLSTLAQVSTGSPVRVEYSGKIKSRKGNQCDNWKVAMLSPKTPAGKAVKA